MDWQLIHQNKDVEAAYASFLSLVDSLSIQYAGNLLLQSIEFSDSMLKYEIPLSRQFCDYATTIKSGRDIQSLINSGDYNRIALEMAVVQLVSALEQLMTSYASIYKVKPMRFDIRQRSNDDQPISTSTETLMIIEALHNELELDTVVKNDCEVYLHLLSIIETRNRIVHASGKVQLPREQRRLKAYFPHIEVGDRILVDSNLYDAFLFYILSHMRALTNALPKQRFSASID